MSDEETRLKTRRSTNGHAPGDLTALEEARANAALTRAGLSQAAVFNRFIGDWIYAETYKMNYRGVLVGVVTDAAGDVVSLLCHPLYRTGDWGNQPDPNYEECMESSEDKPRMLSCAGVCEFGLMPTHWPKSGPAKGAR